MPVPRLIFMFIMNADEACFVCYLLVIEFYLADIITQLSVWFLIFEMRDIKPIMKHSHDIIYTKVDEAPGLASGSFLPIIKAFLKPAGINVGTLDISLAGRIISNFSKYLKPEFHKADALGEISALVKSPDANIIKLPNISASLPQLKQAIKELQDQGYTLPDYPEAPQNDEQRDIQLAYDRVKGSAVNPVLREGNSDRRAPKAVKAYAKKNPHSMGVWTSDSKTHVASMKSQDFLSNETSLIINETQAGDARIELVANDGSITVLKENIKLHFGEIVDASFMSTSALRMFLEEELFDAKVSDVLFSIHLKATMMKVSDPVIFGHAVHTYFKRVFEKYSKTFAELAVNPDLGIGDLLQKISCLPNDQQVAIKADLKHAMATQPCLYMVNSDQGITNLHVSSDVIIDASMPALIREGGKAWGPNGALNDVKCVIPDSSYAAVYSETIDFCKEHGAFNPSEMGTISNIGLMAQKAEEYGSHPQTFILPTGGTINVVDALGNILHQHIVEENDIWRMCTVKDAAVRDWVKLAVSRARMHGVPAVFWLNADRAHDAKLIEKVKSYLNDHDTSGLEIHIMAPREATRFSLERMRLGKDTISVTGNVLRDYLTDLFPILELGTSSKMLSIVPLMNGGGLFETGAGGSAPRHVEQFLKEGHLRWDSLGEFCALAVSLEHLAMTKGNAKAAVIAKALELATEKFLDANKSPSRKVGELDTRGSHFYLTLFWAEALAFQSEDIDLKAHFMSIASSLRSNEISIINELNAAQGASIDLGGYYNPDMEKLSAAMRPSATFNSIIS